MADRPTEEAANPTYTAEVQPNAAPAEVVEASEPVQAEAAQEPETAGAAEAQPAAAEEQKAEEAQPEAAEAQPEADATGEPALDGLDASPEELAAAATKIGAVYRGR